MKKNENPTEACFPECRTHFFLWSGVSTANGKSRVIDALLPEDEEWKEILEKEGADGK